MTRRDILRHPLLRLLAGAALALSAFPALAAGDEPDPIGRFDIVRFDVQGNTLLSSAKVDAVLAPFTGKNRDFGHVQRALEALEAEYHRIGVSVVQVVLPEQELNQGAVRLQVIQTRLGKVRVEGNKFFDEANIRNSLPDLREGETPNIGKISNSLKLANENPSKKTNLQLMSGDKDDEINAVLQVTDEKPWKIGASLDNTGNDSTGKSHLGVLFQHANVAGLDHVASLQYTTAAANPSQVSVYGIGYHIPLYALGDSVDLFASYSDVDSGLVTAGIFDLEVSGKGKVFGGRYTQNLRRVGDYHPRLIYGVDYKAYRNNVSLQGIQLGDDVTVHPASIAYAGTWAMPEGEANFGLTALHNLPGGARGGSADFNRVRAGASASYNILRYGASYSRALPGAWQLRMSASGQYTRDMLVHGEQFGAGGASAVRGFPERELSNDSGHLASAEIYTPNFCSGSQMVSAQCRALAFYDAARVTRNNPLPGEVAQASIASVGVGLRASMDNYLTLQMDYGHVVDAGLTQGKGDHRLHFRLILSY